MPLKWAWLSALHTLCGGSVTVATALIYTIISDVVPENERFVNLPRRKRIALIGNPRAATFFQVMAATITTQFLGPLISATLMIWNPWIPMILGLAVEFISIVTLLFIPETLDYSGSLSPTSSSSSLASAAPPNRSSHWRTLLHRTHSSVSFIVSDIRVLGLFSAFAVHMLFLNRDVMLQYISTRYKISLAQATVLISIRSGLVFLLCVVVLPIVSIYCRNRVGSKRSDLILSRTSAALLTLGFLGLGLAPNLPLLVLALVLNSLGWGLFSFLRSLLTSLVDAHKTARLNTAIGVFDTVGLMIGSPLLAALFTRGVERGGLWFGLPFLLCAGVVAMLTLVLVRINV